MKVHWYDGIYFSPSTRCHTLMKPNASHHDKSLFVFFCHHCQIRLFNAFIHSPFSPIHFHQVHDGINDEDNCNAPFMIIAATNHTLSHNRNTFTIFTFYLAFVADSFLFFSSFSFSFVLFYFTAMGIFLYMSLGVLYVRMWLQNFTNPMENLRNSCFNSIFHLHSITHSNELG